MKKTILILTMILLTSCSMPTQVEIDAMDKICAVNWQSVHINTRRFNELYCRYDSNKVMDCIQEYTRWIDEKYNNPDTVSNLREDNFSNVVKTCNDIFWEKEDNLDK